MSHAPPTVPAPWVLYDSLSLLHQIGRFSRESAKILTTIGFDIQESG